MINELFKRIGFRNFGVEFEVCLPFSKHKDVKKQVGKMGTFVHDGSVDAGAEFVTNIITEKEVDNISQICESLRASGATTDDSCSLHVHFDASFASANENKYIYTLVENLKETTKSLQNAGYSNDGFEIIMATERAATSLSRGHSAFKYLYYVLGENTTQNTDTLNTTNNNNILVSQSVVGLTADNITDYIKRFAPGVSLQRISIVLGDLVYNVILVLDKSERLSDLFGTSEGMPNVKDIKNGKRLSVMILPRNDVNRDAFEKLQRVLLMYTAFENTILSLLPLERRFNDYAAPLTKRLPYAMVQRATRYEDLVAMWRGRHDEHNNLLFSGSKYCGVNLNAISKHGTIEVRYYQGTTDSQEIYSWILLNLAIINYAVNTKNTGDLVRRLNRLDHFTSNEYKLKILLTLIGLADTQISDFWNARQAAMCQEDDKLITKFKLSKFI